MRLFYSLAIAILIFWAFMRTPSHPLISLFPIQHYDQKISDWISPNAPDYDKPLLTNTQQMKRQAEWMEHYLGKKSPWDTAHLHRFYAHLTANNLSHFEKYKIKSFSNNKKMPKQLGYGMNFRPYDTEWISRIENNMDLNQFEHMKFDLTKRAIATQNINSRHLPTADVFFYNPALAGEGYPFDNIQAAVIWAGTPLYILGETKDHEWSLVLSPSLIAWVKNNDLATVDPHFVKQWQQQTKINLAAIIQTGTPIQDTENKLTRFTGYIGMVFPAEINKNNITISIPVSDENRQAHIHQAMLSNQSAAIMPILPTQHQFASLITQLINRPYGWGGTGFYNDCSSELKNLFTPFEIFLPMHSSDQVDPTEYHVNRVDLSSANMHDRLAYLKQHGHKLMTIVHVGEHVFLYLGNYNDTALSYQNIWALRPKNKSKDKSWRSVIGKSVLLPILESYPEDRKLGSIANRKYFQLGFLDEEN